MGDPESSARIDALLALLDKQEEAIARANRSRDRWRERAKRAEAELAALKCNLTR